jgi:hypothetical protein
MKNKYYTVEKIIGMKIIRMKVVYLIKWKGFTLKDSTWEPLSNFKDNKYFEKLLENFHGKANEYMEREKNKELKQTSKSTDAKPRTVSCKRKKSTRKSSRKRPRTKTTEKKKPKKKTIATKSKAKSKKNTPKKTRSTRKSSLIPSLNLTQLKINTFLNSMKKPKRSPNKECPTKKKEIQNKDTISEKTYVEPDPSKTQKSNLQREISIKSTVETNQNGWMHSYPVHETADSIEILSFDSKSFENLSNVLPKKDKNPKTKRIFKLKKMKAKNTWTRKNKNRARTNILNLSLIECL